MTTRFNRLGKLVRRGGRSPVVTGGAAPTITVAPVLAWTVEIGNNPTLTDPVYTGDAGTITWTLYRDGVADGTIANVSKATAEAYAAVAGDIGPELHFEATVTNGTGSDSDVTNTVVFNDATYLPDTAIGVSTSGLTLADSDTTVDSWASSLGGVSATVAAPSASQRPTYDATGGAGGRPRVTADGANDCLRLVGLTKGSDFATAEWGQVYASGAAVPNGARFVDYYNSTSFRFSTMSTGGLAGAYLNGTSVPNAGAAAISATPEHDHASWDGSTVTRMRAGTSTGALAKTGTVPDGGTLTLFAYNGGASSFAPGSMQAWHIGPELTSGQRTHLRALLTYHTGVAC